MICHFILMDCILVEVIKIREFKRLCLSWGKHVWESELVGESKQKEEEQERTEQNDGRGGGE